MTSSLTASLVLDIARGRHPAFAQTVVPDGSILQAIDTRQRTLILQYGGAIEGLISTTVDLAILFSGILIGNNNGVPQYGTTFQDGWPAHMTAGGIPYVDFTQPKIAGDPFGQNGGTPGFPLPNDFLKLIQVSATMQDLSFRRIDVVPEKQRLERQFWFVPTTFVSGNRLVPIRPLASGNSGDPWGDTFLSLQLSYVALPHLASLSDAITLPAALTEALIAGTAEYLAMNSTAVSGADKASMSRMARMAEEGAGAYGMDVIGSAIAPQHVIYRR